MSSVKSIDVVLATYNGERFLKDQIDSIILNFERLVNYKCRLLISDDGSTDNTLKLIDLLYSNDERIFIVNKERTGGVKSNFLTLLDYVEGDYLFFSDQDDFWLPNKISLFMEVFEENNKYDKPLLVHSDLTVTDVYLSPKHVSMFSYQNLNKNASLENCLVTNNVTGCVMACNKQLVDRLRNSKLDQSIMHDWYASLIAHIYGKVIFIDKSLILYRQHGGNQVGAKKISIRSAFNHGIKGSYSNVLKSIQMTKNQSKLLYDDLTASGFIGKEIDVIEKYNKSFDANFIFRFFCFFKSGFKKYGLKRNLIFFFVYVFCGKSI